jgi:hypothetical protein
MKLRQAIFFLALFLPAGCSSVPSYYSDRVTSRPSPQHVASAPSEQPSSRPRKQARKAVSVVQSVSLPPQLQQPARTNGAENTGSGDAAPIRRPAVTEPWDPVEGAAAEERRERALVRTMNSICRGC